jgi:hypothetical protein
LAGTAGGGSEGIAWSIVFCTEVGEQSLNMTCCRSDMRSMLIFRGGDRSGDSKGEYLLLKE